MILITTSSDVAGERQTMWFVHCCNTNSENTGHADDLQYILRKDAALSYLVMWCLSAAIMSKLFFHVTIMSDNNDQRHKDVSDLRSHLRWEQSVWRRNNHHIHACVNRYYISNHYLYRFNCLFVVKFVYSVIAYNGYSGDETTETVRWCKSDQSTVFVSHLAYCISAVKCMSRQPDDLQAYLRRVTYAHV